MPDSENNKIMPGFWQLVPDAKLDAKDTFWLVWVGFLVGLCAAAVVSVFRICADWSYAFSIRWTASLNRTFFHDWLWIFLAIVAALIVGRLILNPAIRYGGSPWVRKALVEGQPRVWRIILAPKFFGSFLVKSFGVSVGMEGPSIQMGCATALGLKNFTNKDKIERRFFILGGCAAGLSAAFSAPFAGICWSYEILREKMDPTLFIFMLAGSFGVYMSCTQIFGLGTMLPFKSTPMPDLARLWILIPLGLFAGAVGIAYNYLLRFFIKAYAAQKWLPERYRPLFPFGGAIFLIFIFPAVTGEGFTVFAPIEAGQTTAAWLCLFLVVKLLFTGYCYGSGVPAGLMVPVLCVGGVTGAIFGDWFAALGWLGPEYAGSCIVMGMAGSFAAAERAPVTALVLVAQTTGAWEVSLGMLFVACLSAFFARLAKVKLV